MWWLKILRKYRRRLRTMDLSSYNLVFGYGIKLQAGDPRGSGLMAHLKVEPVYCTPRLTGQRREGGNNKELINYALPLFVLIIMLCSTSALFWVLCSHVQSWYCGARFPQLTRWELKWNICITNVWDTVSSWMVQYFPFSLLLSTVPGEFKGTSSAKVVSYANRHSSRPRYFVLTFAAGIPVDSQCRRTRSYRRNQHDYQASRSKMSRCART